MQVLAVILPIHLLLSKFLNQLPLKPFKAILDRVQDKTSAKLEEGQLAVDLLEFQMPRALVVEPAKSAEVPSEEALSEAVVVRSGEEIKLVEVLKSVAERKSAVELKSVVVPDSLKLVEELDKAYWFLRQVLSELK
jgi:hypothetical protein